MKLLINLIEFRHGANYGFEEYVTNLLNTFVVNRSLIKFEEVIVVVHESQVSYLNSICKGSLMVVPLRFKSSWQKFLCNENLERTFNLTRSDVIFYPCNETTLSKSKVKSIVVVHDLLYAHSNFFDKSLDSILLRLHRIIFVPRAIRAVNTVIAISNFTKKEIAKLYGMEDKIKVIYNYFHFAKYVEDSNNTIRIEGPYILSISAGYVHKRQVIVLQSFIRFLEYHPHYKLVIVGRLYKDAQEYYDQLPDKYRSKILLYCRLSNMQLASLYKKASAYVSASLYEGLGMPVVEAMYFGLPVILSDTLIHREVSFNEGVYCKCDDVADFCNGLEISICNRSSVPDVKERIRSRYSEENTAFRYIREFNSLYERDESLDSKS